MNRTELIGAIAEKTGASKKDAAAALGAVVDAVTEALKAGEKVSLPGFGTFQISERAARTGKNPRTGETVEIPARRAPVFKASKALKEAVEVE